jgi:hypothetical protein
MLATMRRMMMMKKRRKDQKRRVQLARSGKDQQICRAARNEPSKLHNT